MLAAAEPYPAFVLDRRWTILRPTPRRAMSEFWRAGPSGPGHAHRAGEPRVALMSPERPAPFIVNWEEVALSFLRGVQADALADGTRRPPRCSASAAVPGAPALSRVLAPDEIQAPVLVIHFRRDETSLVCSRRWRQLGTPQT